MLKANVVSKKQVIKLLLTVVILATQAQFAIARPRQDQNNTEAVNECTPRDLDVAALIKGLVLRSKAGKFLNNLVAEERLTKGYQPQIFIVARAGQNLSGAMVLRDLNSKGQVMTVQDIFKEVMPYGAQSSTEGGGGTQTNLVQMDIKKKFKDPNRQLVYSHLGILVLDHSIKRVEHTFDKGEKLICPQCEYMVDELLKPCESMVPKKWITGLAGFYQDDPHEYRTIFMIPTPEMQAEIKKIIDEKEDGAYVLREGRNNFDLFLGDHYNAAAKYTDLKEQNSNQYVLEVIAAAQMRLKTDRLNSQTTRKDVLDYLTETGFRPTKIIADSFKMSFATSWFAPKSLEIHDRDNPYARPYGVTEFVTELSVREWMQRQGIIASEKDLHSVLITEDDVKNDTEVKKITEEQARALMDKAKKITAARKAAEAKAKK